MKTANDYRIAFLDNDAEGEYDRQLIKALWLACKELIKRDEEIERLKALNPAKHCSSSTGYFNL